jgi:dipeptidyl aminopeptidase/acylaminoacyl peptidase
VSVGPPVERIVYSETTPSGELRFFVLDADGSGTPTPFGPPEDFELRNLSPDGSRFAVVAPNEDGLLVGGTVEVDGSGYVLFEVDDPTLNLACGVWGPKGRMACEGWDDSDPSRAGIYTVEASDGSDPKRLTRHRDIPCEYSPDGTALAFVRLDDEAATGRLIVMDAAGGKARPLLDDVRLSGIPCDWSPDGHSILTASNGSMVTVDRDGESSPVTGDGIDGFVSGAVWSLDGSHILFDMALEGDQFDVYTITAEGFDLVRLTDSDVLEEAANWLP